MSRQYPPRPIVGVGAVVFRDEGVLLVRRGKPPSDGQWSLPGGAQQVGETVFAAGRREVKEETGLDIEILGIVDVVDSIRRDEEDRVQYHYTLVDVFAEAGPGEAVACDDAADAAWFGLDELDGLDLWTETVRVIRLAHEMWSLIGPASAPR